MSPDLSPVRVLQPSMIVYIQEFKGTESKIIYLKRTFRMYKLPKFDSYLLMQAHKAILTHISLASFFKGHKRTVQTQIRHEIMQCLIRIFAVCLQNVLLNFGEKRKKYHRTPLK